MKNHIWVVTRMLNDDPNNSISVCAWRKAWGEVPEVGSTLDPKEGTVHDDMVADYKMEIIGVVGEGAYFLDVLQSISDMFDGNGARFVSEMDNLVSDLVRVGLSAERRDRAEAERKAYDSNPNNCC